MVQIFQSQEENEEKQFKTLAIFIPSLKINFVEPIVNSLDPKIQLIFLLDPCLGAYIGDILVTICQKGICNRPGTFIYDQALSESENNYSDIFNIHQHYSNMKFDDIVEKAYFSSCNLKFRIKDKDYSVHCQNLYTAFEVKSLSPTQNDYESGKIIEVDSKLKIYRKLREMAEDDAEGSLIHDPNIFLIPEPTYIVIENPTLSKGIAVHSSIPGKFVVMDWESVNLAPLHWRCPTNDSYKSPYHSGLETLKQSRTFNKI